MQGRQSPGSVLTALVLLVVVTAVGGTALSFSSLRSIILQEARRSAASRAVAAAQSIDEALSRGLRTVEAIAGDEEIRLAVGGSRNNLAATRDHLLFYRRSFGFLSCTVLDKDGKLITSTDPGGALWHSGGNGPAPAWFASARGGDAAVHLSADGETQQQRIVYSRPVYGKGDSPAGVAYVETGAGEITRLTSDIAGGILVLSGEDGLVLLASEEQLIGTGLWNSLGAGEGRARSGSAGTSPGEARDRAGRTWEVYERELQCCPGWTVTYLHDLEAFTATRAAPVIDRIWYGAAGTCLAAVLAAAVLWLGSGRTASRPRPPSGSVSSPETPLSAEGESALSARLSPADMSRSLRAPLDSTIDIADSLLAEPPGNLTGDQEKRLRLARSRTARLRSLLDDIIDIDRMEASPLAPDPEHFNAANLLRETSCSFDAVAAGKGIALLSDSGGELFMYAHRDRVKQVIFDLVRVALTIAPRGSSVALGASRDNGKVRFFVRETRQPSGRPDDAGAGEDEGVDLTLYVSDRVARLLGGRLEVARHPGAGSEFTLTLPAGGASDG